MKDLHSKLKVVSLIDAQTAAADTTPVAVDRQGYEAVEIVLSIGIGGITFSGTNKVEFVLTHSDDNSSYTNVADADMLGVTGIANGIIKSLVAAHAAATVHRYGYKGGKRYLKLLADYSGTHGTGTPIGANALLAAGYNKPEAAQA
jgi:hypothetical protein